MSRFGNSLKYLLPSSPSAYIFPIAFLAFLCYKIPWLNLPLYWDEAWSYGNAVFRLYEKGVWFLPGNADPGLTRGHPLLFYQLAVLWIRLAGPSLLSVHIFALLLSCLLVAALYSICRDLLGRAAAGTASLFLLAQPVFLAQSTLLLPEVLLALLTLTTVHAYLRNNRGWYILSASLLVLTKESGMVAVAAVVVDRLLLSGNRLAGMVPQHALQVKDPIHPVDQKNNLPFPPRAREMFWLFVPFLVFAAFLVEQKIRYGYFLYPEHTGMIVTEGKTLLSNVKLVFSRLLMQNGRNVFLFLFLPCLAYYIFLLHPGEKERNLIRVSLLFILMYCVFSAFNFFTVRYILSPLPFYLASGSLALLSSLGQRKVLRGVVLSGLFMFFLYHSFAAPKNESDVSRGFRDTVLVQQEAARYAASMQWQKKLLYTTFLMQYYLSDKYFGYLDDSSESFTRVSNARGLPYDLFLFCSNENDPFYGEVSGNTDYLLVRRLERNGSWVEFYRPSEKIPTDPSPR